MSILCPDGYEYADIAQRILGRPLENARNQAVVSYRFHQKPEGFIAAFCEAFDREKADQPNWAARQAGHRAAAEWEIRQSDANWEAVAKCFHTAR